MGQDALLVPCGGDQETGFAWAAEGAAEACIAQGGTHPLPFQSARPLGSHRQTRAVTFSQLIPPQVPPKGRSSWPFSGVLISNLPRYLQGDWRLGENKRNLRLKRARGPWHQEEGLL